MLPWAAALWLGDANLLLFSALMFGAAAGDLVIVLQTLSLPRDAYVLDRPDAIGFEVVAPRAAD